MDPNLPDLEMVIVDVPGLNESGTSQMYKDYVRNNFASFDYVMIVMDVNQVGGIFFRHDGRQPNSNH